ncbi:hypothetical protein VNO77_05649 [Canavalia gladiata]|uniref:Uncharacterized protein n=1 Tax=Canavalia gladiata TaxID=3824 RepID=A0AAN9MYQ5_CANGL
MVVLLFFVMRHTRFFFYFFIFLMAVDTFVLQSISVIKIAEIINSGLLEFVHFSLSRQPLTFSAVKKTISISKIL